MPTETPPAAPAILLATDLSSRCDRALERAITLAAARGAVLHVATVLEGDRRDAAFAGRERDALDALRADVTEALEGRALTWEPIVATGDPARAVIDAAARTGAELIITGVARNEVLGRVTPGRAVETLIRCAPAPVLAVRRRAAHPYERILVPTDFTRAAELGLVRAAAMFPDAKFTLLHGYRVPFAGFIDEEGHRDEFTDQARRDQAAFIAKVEARTGESGRIVGLVEYGEADQLVADYIDDNAPDLMVLGAHDHSGLLGALCPDVAGRLLMSAGCDVLVVPEASQKGAKAS